VVVEVAENEYWANLAKKQYEVLFKQSCPGVEVETLGTLVNETTNLALSPGKPVADACAACIAGEITVAAHAMAIATNARRDGVLSLLFDI